MKDDLVHVSRYSVTTADTDMNTRLRLGSLVNMLIQSAIKSADELGFGYKNLTERGLFWVFSRLTLDIQKPLLWYDVADVETWPKDIDRLFYLRDFIIRNEKEKVVASATSSWLALDLKTRRPGHVAKDHIEAFTRHRDKHAIREATPKLFEIGEGESFDFEPRYFDIDLNQHVTATRYIDWMMDTFQNKFHHHNYPRKLVINYMKEVLPGEAMKLVRKKVDEHTFNFEGTNATNQSAAVRGMIGF